MTDDNIIEEDVVRISPSLKGFRQKLKADLREALAGVEPSIKVKLVADKRGFAASVREQLATVNIRPIKVPVVADTRGFASSLRGIDRDAKITIKARVDRSQVDREAEKAKRDAERAGKAEAADTERREKATTRVVEREVARRRAAANSAFGNAKAPQLIDFGGEGVRPLNLLYGVVAAMSPVLIAMASSTIQASTSLVALGAAGIGAALGIGGVLVSLQNITAAWALRKSVMAQQATAAENSARTSTKNAAEELRQRDSLIDSQKAQLQAEKDLHDARVEAARDLVDMRQKLADLQNQEKDDALSVAEAQAKRQQVYSNFFASGLDRLRADQDVRNAQQQQSDTTVERKKTQQDLAAGVKKGVEGSDKVAKARDQLRLARERRQEALADSKTGALGGAVSKVTSPMAQLDQLLARMSPAGRELYHWLDANEKTLRRMQNTVEQGVLPGITQFLREITAAPKRGKSTLQLAAEYAGQLGGELTKTLAKAGKLSQSTWFRQSMATIQKHNVAATKTVGNTGLTLIRPVTQLLTAASPLVEKMANGLQSIATWFSNWIDQAQHSGALTKWFADAWHNATLLFDIVKNVGSILVSVFTGSLPTGDNLLDRLDKFIKGVADWAKSPTGQDKITAFFEIFKNLPYGKIGTFFLQAATVFAGIKAVTWAAANPFWTGLGILVKEHPEAALSLVSGLSDFVVTLSKHQGALELLGTVLAAAKVYKTVTLGLNISPLKTLLTNKFSILDKFIGGAKAATMTVRAGVVNVYGGGGAGQKGGGSNLLLGGGLTIAAVLAAIFAGRGFDEGKHNKSPLDDARNLMKDPSAGNFGKALGFFSPLQWGAAAVGKLVGDPQGVLHWFSITLPNALNPGNGEGGWSGLGKNLGHWFSTTMPNWMSGGTGGWSGLGKSMWNDFKNWIGVPAVQGLWNGISGAAGWLWNKLSGWASGFWAWLKKLFGVASPSTMTADIGDNLIQGLWNGFTEKWTNIHKTLTKWIDSNITGPLVSLFGDIGGKIKSAFTKPFETLGAALVAPVKRAFDWVNTNLIDKLNVLLGAIGVATIAHIEVGGASPGQSFGNVIGGVVGKAAPVVKKADGGRVGGSSPHSRADNIPAMLTANEFVQPVDAVKHYGTDFMEAVRTRQFPKYATGGLVAAGLLATQGSNLATEIISGALRGVSLAGIAQRMMSSPASGDSSGGTVSGDAGVAATAEAVARRMGATDKQLIALVEAGLVESGMHNLDHGDRDSLGFLQQRPSQGWGTPAQVMDVAHATRSFMTRAMHADRGVYSPGQLAQAVQRSAFPDRYDKRYADAVAVLNSLPPYLSNAGTAGPMFGPWPPSAASVHGHDSGIWRKIIALVPPALNPGKYGDLYHNRVTDNGGWSWHASGRAVDFMGYNQDALAGFFEARKGAVLELIHSTKHGNYGVQRGHDHDMGHEYGLHKNHLHVAMAKGGQVRKYDTGGTLPPGFTMAYNGTGRNETIRTANQEAALTGPVRLDRRDLTLLAAHIAQAASPTVHMDGQKVAAITNAYSYLPAGV